MSTTIDVSQFSAKSIIYFLYNGKKIVYIGQSGVGFSRPLSHIHKKKITKIKVFEAPEHKVLRIAIENFYISKHKPPLNSGYRKLTLDTPYINEDQFRKVLKDYKMNSISGSLRKRIKQGEIQAVYHKKYLIPISEALRICKK